MIRRPPWEARLRRKIRRRRKLDIRRWRVPRVLRQPWFAIVFGSIFLLTMIGTAGGGTAGYAVSLFAGLAGAGFGLQFRNAWQWSLWIAFWTPACDSTVRRMQTREMLPKLAVSFALVLGFCSLATSISSVSNFGVGLAAAVTGFACGFLLVGTRIGFALLALGCLVVVGLGMVRVWFGSGVTPDFLPQLPPLARQFWLPAWAWEAVSEPAGLPPWKGGALILSAIFSAIGWRREWMTVGVVAVIPDESGGIEGEAEAACPKDEAVHRNLLDRLLDRTLTAREHRLGSLSSEKSGGLWLRTAWVALLLAPLSAWPWLARRAAAGGFEQDSAPVMMTAFALAAVALASSWPGRVSRFRWLLAPLDSSGLGPTPAISLVPVTVAEWLAASGKEWCVRSLWSGALWGVAAVVFRLALDGTGGMVAAFAVVAGPWVFFVSLFPFIAAGRLGSAFAGEEVRVHGIGWSLPTILTSVLCGLCGFLATVFLMISQLGAALGAVAVAGLSGSIGLALTHGRFSSPRQDLRPPGRPGERNDG